MTGGIVHVRSTADPQVVALKVDPELRFIMGRFSAARYDETSRTYLVHSEHRRALALFARTHQLTLVHVFDKPAVKLTGPALSPETMEAMAEVQKLRSKPDQLAAATKRGVALCRIVLAGAKMKADRKRSGSA